MVASKKQRLVLLLNKLKTKFHSINTFESVPPSVDPHTLHNQTISTWLFILLLISSIAVLLFYNTFVPVQKTFTVQQPTYDQYLDLFSKYSNNLQCPCKTVSVTYDRFLQVNYTSHYICSSFLVSEQWIQYLVRLNNRGPFYPSDFRAVSRPTFQALRSFCQLADETIENSLTSFYETQYVSAYLTASELFHQQNAAQIQQFQLSTTKTFVSSLSLIRQTTQANALLAGTQGNFNLFLWPSDYYLRSLRTAYSGCSCGETPSCFAPAVIYNTNRYAPTLFVVPGFYSGCYTIESLLVSSFQCFYDEQCFNKLTYYVNSTLKINTTVLNASLSTKFTANSTVGEMMNDLMVEQWNSSITFAKYYDECKPSECSYTIGSRNDAIFIATTVFGLVGGLVTILRIIVPRLIDYIRRKKSHEKTKTGELPRKFARIRYFRRRNDS